MIRRLPRLPRDLMAKSKTLTPRESEVAQLIADGLNDAEIGERLSIGPHAANDYARAIKSKLGARHRFHLVALLVNGRGPDPFKGWWPI